MESRDHGVAGDSGSWELPPIDGLPPPLDQLEIFAGAGIWDWDLRRQRLYRSPGWRRLYGRFDPNEQPFEIGDWLSWLIPADRGPAQAELDRLLAGDESAWRFQFRVAWPSGEVRTLRSVAQVLRDERGAPVRMVGVDRDVTAEVANARALGESEERYALAVEATHEALFDWDIAKRTMHHTVRAAEIYGFVPTTAGATLFRFLRRVDRDDRSTLLRAVRDHLADGSRFDRVFRYRRPDGAQRWLRARGDSQRDAIGRAVRMVGAVADVTEEFQVRRVWQITETAARIGGWEVDLLRGELFCSPGVHHLIERSPHQEPLTIDAALAYVRDGDSRGRARQLLDRAARTGESIDEELEIETPSGRRLRVHVLGEAIIEHGRPVRLQGSVQDVTQRRELEQQFLHAQKLESVGRLAGGIAHDFNNLLTVIAASASMAPGDDPAVAHELEIIRETTTRAAELTRRLLTFARREDADPEPLDLCELVRSTTRLLRKVIGEAIEVRIELPPQETWVFADPGQLEQVLMNLGVNARDAMPDGGLLTIRVGEFAFGPERATATPLPPGRYVRLEVVDDGVGVRPEHRARVFEPFFTTKPSGEGSGLGLATCYGIVRRAGGTIDIEPVAPSGTCVTVLLPCHPRPAQPRSAPVHRRDATPVGRRILVVEDENPVRDVIVRALRHGPNEVLAADGAVMARQLAERLGSPPDVLVSDVVMPGVSGVDLARELRERWPTLPVLFVSGYNEEIGPELLHDGRTRFLAKPFGPDQLREAVAGLCVPVAGESHPG